MNDRFTRNPTMVAHITGCLFLRRVASTQLRMMMGLGLLALATTGHSQPSADFALSVTGRVNSIALQPDGKILVIGGIQSLGGQPLSQEVTRLNQDGTVDGTFKQTRNGGINCLSVQEDGKILLAGLGEPPIDRLNSDGSGDKSFTNSPAPGLLQVYALIVQEDGKILARGAGDSGPAIQPGR